MLKKKTVYLLAFLALLNLAAHFLPPERASLGPDDYVFLDRAARMEVSDILTASLKVSDRPLNYLASMLQAKLIKDNPAKAFWLLVLTSTLLLFAVFFFFARLLKERGLAFILSILFCLIPNKFEVYQNSVFLNLNLAITAALLSLTLFLCFAESRRKYLLFISICAYLVSIFWYAVGFFIPAMVLLYCLIFRKDLMKFSLFYIFTGIFYLAYRYSGGFGFADQVLEGYRVQFSLIPWIPSSDLFRHYFGRYMLRNIIYGAYGFFSMEKPWLAALAAVDLLFLGLFHGYLSRGLPERPPKKMLLFLAGIFILFLSPFLLHKGGGIASRYLLLPSIPVAVFIYWGFTVSKKFTKNLLVAFFGITLVISQGDSGIQVVASRINASIYQALGENKDRLLNSRYVVLDSKSLMENINFTILKNTNNIFETYYGVQVFHQAELSSMVNLITGNKESEFYIAASQIEKTGNQDIKFSVKEVGGYGVIQYRSVKLPQADVFVVGYAEIYKNGFKQGKQNGP